MRVEVPGAGFVSVCIYSGSHPSTAVCVYKDQVGLDMYHSRSHSFSAMLRCTWINKSSSCLMSEETQMLLMNIIETSVNVVVRM